MWTGAALTFFFKPPSWCFFKAIFLEPSPMARPTPSPSFLPICPPTTAPRPASAKKRFFLALPSASATSPSASSTYLQFLLHQAFQQLLLRHFHLHCSYQHQPQSPRHHQT